MSKKIVIPKSINQIKNLINYCDGFIIGVEGLSVNYPFYFSFALLSEIESLCSKNNKDLFVSLNKNIHNSDLDILKSSLIKLSNMKLSGIIFYDIAIVNLNEKLGLNLNLIWNQEHMVTNFNTINYWVKKGIYGSYLSSELTKAEIIEIKDNINCPIMMNVFGYIPMFTSKRPLVKNYLEKFDLKDNSFINYIEKEGNIYPIVSDDVTTVYSSKILNLTQDIIDFINSGIDYFVLNSFNINDDIFLDVIILFNEITEKNKLEIFNKVNMLLGYKTDMGFLYKKTVYRVKKNG